MSYRVDGGVKVGGGHRPWGTEPSPDRSRAIAYKETEAVRRERETCLSCDLPVCNQNYYLCPLNNLTRPPQKNCRGIKPLPVPEEFHVLGPGPMTNDEIAKALNVSNSTVKRWRKKFGYQRTRIDRGTKDGN